MIKKLIRILFCCLLYVQIVYPQCTSFCFTPGDTVLFGNTLDWYFSDGLIVVNKRGVTKTALGFSNPAKWTSKYGSITINQWGREFPQRGMNEAGLAVGEMTLSETQFPSSDSRPAISNPQWIQYQLDNCATVEEVIATDSKIRMDHNEYHSHFLVADSSGNCVTMEWLNGKLVYHTAETLPLKVITNSQYESLLEFYAQKTPHAVDDYCTWARFYRVAELIENYNSVEDGPALNYAWKIHVAVTKPYRTRWILLFDLKKLRFYLKTDLNMNARYVDLKSFDYSCSTPVKMLDANSNISGDMRQYFVDYDPEINKALVRKIAVAHGPITGTVSEWYIVNSGKYPETTICNSPTDAESQDENFQGYKLYQNYPNPFNPSTTINYQLSVFDNIKLNIFDTLGQKIKTLVDSFQTTGEYSIVWNGTDESNNQVPSGVYFYSLLSNELILQKKMILIR